MAEVKLFNINDQNQANLIQVKGAKLEKHIQSIIENNLENIFGIRMLATEYSIDEGRVDTLGLDENNCPVIIEYKLDSNTNVINQGLFYLDWFMNHKAEFDLLCREKLGNKIDIDWDNPRLLCIATDFNKYDDNAIRQINRNIELIRYTLFENNYLMIQLASASLDRKHRQSNNKNDYTKDTMEYRLGNGTPKIKSYIEELDEYILSLGDDVQKKELKLYWAYKTIKNLACVLINNKDTVGVYLSIDYEKIGSPRENVENVKDKGHWGTGNTAIYITNDNDLEYAKKLIYNAYFGLIS